MDNENIWCRTLLTSYRALNTFSKTLDNTLEKLALKGFNGYSSGYSTDMLYDKMLEVIDRKKGLVNIKVLVDRAMSMLPVKDYEILKLRYFDGVDAMQSAEVLGLNDRTYFRRLNKALSAFMFNVKREGYDVERIKREYKNESFIVALYQRLLKKSLCNVAVDKPMKKAA